VKKYWFAFLMLLSVNLCHASLTITVYSTYSGAKLGTIRADDTIYGLLLTPKLTALSPGAHGFHVHECADCDVISGHWDPSNSKEHDGPFRGNGHLGDLPVLIVNRAGAANLPVLAPRLKLDMIKNHSLVIDAGSDTYSDAPKINGGGGARIACGAIPYFN
jgi:Cu-Zn family superoxide dismutase